MDRRIEEKAREISGTPRDDQGRLKDELKSLQQGRDRLKKQKQILDSKLQEGAILSPQEQRRFVFEIFFSIKRHFITSTIYCTILKIDI